MNIKRLFSVILAAGIVVSLASCKLIRKIEKDEDSEKEYSQSEALGYDTDFQSVAESETQQVTGALSDEQAAYDFLLASFDDKDKKNITLEKTGDMTAQSNGNEYYIIKAEKTVEESPDGSSGTETVFYYVSVNGLIYTELEEANATTSILKEAFLSKNGECDSETGLKYCLEYKGLIQNKGEYCFNFEVLLEKESGETEYKTNYIVSLDGKASATQALK